MDKTSYLSTDRSIYLTETVDLRNQSVLLVSGGIYNPTSSYSKALTGSGCARGGASRSRGRARPPLAALLGSLGGAPLGLARRGLGLSPACRAPLPRRCPGLSRPPSRPPSRAPSRRGESRRRRASDISGVVAAAALLSLPVSLVSLVSLLSLVVSLVSLASLVSLVSL